jgi:hypothetical protein
MAIQYLVVVSGTVMHQSDLNTLGASSWDLVQIVLPEEGLQYYHIFKK